MIQTVKIETILKEYYKTKSGLMVIYYWDWRINRFIRDYNELLNINKTTNLNGLDFNSEFIEIDISTLKDNKDILDTLIKYMKRYNFKYIIV
jgi:hypothetical protein